MLESIKEDEIDFMEDFYNPIALSECLFHNFDVLGSFDETALGHIRNGQLPLVSYEYLLDDNPQLSKKENFKLKEGAGTIYCVGGRRFGKTLIVEIIDILISLVLNDGEWAGLASLDAIHVRGVIEKVIVALDRHPFYRIFDVHINRSPNFRIEARNGYLLESVNMNLLSKNSGAQFFQKHFSRLYLEECSFESDAVYKQRQDSISEDGCVVRAAGMTNFTKYSPIGRIFYDYEKRGFVCNLPQYINPKWDEKEKDKALKEQGGASTSCFDSKTEILTKNGWKTYSTIIPEDEVLSLNLKNNVASYYPLSNIFISDYDGEMLSYNGVLINFCLTPNHNLVIKTGKNKEWRIKEIQQILSLQPIKKLNDKIISDVCLKCNKKLDKKKKQKYFCSRSCQMKYQTFIHYPVNKFTIKRDFIFGGNNYFPKGYITFKSESNCRSYRFKIEDWFEFLGWFISEGSISENNLLKYTGYDYNLYPIQIAQSNYANPKNVEQIHSLLKRMNVTYKYYDYGKKGGVFRFTSKLIGKHLIEFCGKGSKNKKIPLYAKNSSPKLLTILLNSLVKGDGTWKNEKIFYYTTSSSQLANDVQEIAYKTGTPSLFYIDNRELFRVHNRIKDSDVRIHIPQIKKEKYTGKIWCVETYPFHTVFARRNGKCFWSGNSFRIFIKGEVVEEGISEIDMERVRKFYDEERMVKHFEINKINFLDFKNIIILDKPKQTVRCWVDADIGETAPTEIIILFEFADKFHYEYKITLYNLTDKEQFQIFDYIVELLEPNFIGLDVTEGTGRSIFRRLEEKYGREHLVWCAFNAKLVVDFERDDRNNVIFKNGKPVEKEEYVNEWSIKVLKELLYEGKFDLPIDYQLDVQLNSVISTLSGNRRIYECASEEDHLFSAFKVFAISYFLNQFNASRPLMKKTFSKISVGE